MSLPSSYRSRRGHIHLPRVLPLVGCRSKTPTLRSEGCVLVPWSSGTPVATWAWPTWVVSRRRVLEAVFTLLEFPSPSRRIFIGSHSLPPGSPYQSFKWYQSRFGSLLTLISLRSKDGVPGIGFGSSTLRCQELPDVE
jgi:hypothetical protein